jgi:hypothetical protein
MKASTHSFEQACLICQQAKPNRAKYPSLLAQLLVLEGAWQVILMDFIGLPKSGSANCILVVVYKFSKYNHFIPLLHPFTTISVAQTFLDSVYKLHGMPLAIISDRDRVFTSAFWQEMFKLTQVRLQMSSSDLARRAHQKLAFKIFGPYQITEMIGTVAYQLALPADRTIHPVFHVSQLKKMVTPSLNVSPTLPDPSATIF